MRPGAAGALIGGGAADFFHEQGVDAAVGIEARDAGQAAVDDDAHAIDGEGGFGDIRGDDDLALAIAGEGGILIGRRGVRRAAAGRRIRTPARELRTASMVR